MKGIGRVQEAEKEYQHFRSKITGNFSIIRGESI